MNQPPPAKEGDEADAEEATADESNVGETNAEAGQLSTERYAEMSAAEDLILRARIIMGWIEAPPEPEAEPEAEEAAEAALSTEPGAALQYGATEGFDPLREQLAAQDVAIVNGIGQVLLAANRSAAFQMPDRPALSLLRSARSGRVAAARVTGAISIRTKGLAVPPETKASAAICRTSRPSWAAASRSPKIRWPGEATAVSRFSQAPAPTIAKQMG